MRLSWQPVSVCLVLSAAMCVNIAVCEPQDAERELLEAFAATLTAQKWKDDERQLIEIVLTDADAGRRAGAALVLGHFPVDFVDHGRVTEALVEALGDTNDQVRLHAANSLGWVDPGSEKVLSALVGLLSDSSVEVRIAAVRALGGMGEKGAAALPALRGAVEQGGTVALQARGALVGVTGEAMPHVRALVEALNESNASELRQTAARLLVEVGAKLLSPFSDEVVSALVDASEAEEGYTAASAARALGRLSLMPEKAVPALLKLVAPVKTKRKDRTFARLFAARALGRFPQYKHDIIPVLEEIVREEISGETHLAMRALESLALVGGVGESLYRPFEEVFENEDATLQAVVLWYLGAIPRPPETFYKEALDALDSKDSILQSAPREYLAKLRQQRERLLSAFTEAMEAASASVRERAASELADEYLVVESSIVAALVKGLADTEIGVVSACVVALARLGPAARGAVPDLKSLQARCAEVPWRGAVSAAHVGELQRLIGETLQSLQQ